MCLYSSAGSIFYQSCHIKYICYLSLLVIISYLEEENGSIYFRRMFVARLFKPKQTFNRVSPVLVFFKVFYENNFYVTTYICASSVDVQLYIRKYSPFGKRYRLFYVRESDSALVGDTAGSQIFWQHCKKKTPRNLNFPRI